MRTTINAIALAAVLWATAGAPAAAGSSPTFMRCMFTPTSCH